eukprot:749518-Hanusia_phi.AAC.3
MDGERKVLQSPALPLLSLSLPPPSPPPSSLCLLRRSSPSSLLPQATTFVATLKFGYPADDV